MIISASRRTDIPAFFMRWFMSRVRAGSVSVVNPFNAAQRREVSLAPADVDAIVFWTRDARNLLPHIDELENRGLRFFVQLTLTGYPKALEPKAPPVESAVATVRRLSERIGKSRVIWRYDPILLTNLTPPEFHRRNFATLAAALDGAVDTVTLSIADDYRKSVRNLKRVPGLTVPDTAEAAQLLGRSGLMEAITDEAAHRSLGVVSCAEPLLAAVPGITPRGCIDAGYLRREYGLTDIPGKDRNQRRECLCVASVDIGAYDTCAFDCAYCYAVSSPEAAALRRKRHSAEGAALID
ncbi:MAG: DUF1848 domain-containing protein [Methylobacteriaceae bacterium]|jgi:hypothetical protein|nr:DUF1848 domain-containing protein [Methylobacteriaceae bacterium]